MNYPVYDPQSALTPLSEQELAQLERTLSALEDAGAMSLDGLDGYLSALLVGPGSSLTQLATAHWLPAIWGGDLDAEGSAPFASNRQRKDTVVLVLRHLRHLQHLLSEAAEDWEPIFSVAETDTQEWVDARDWCTGFMQAVDLQPEAWESAWDDAVTGPMLAPVVQLGGGLATSASSSEEDAEDLDDPQDVDVLSRMVPDRVLALRAHFHPQP